MPIKVRMSRNILQSIFITYLSSHICHHYVAHHPESENNHALDKYSIIRLTSHVPCRWLYTKH